MKDNNWKQIVQMHGTLRLFCNLAIRKTPKGEADGPRIPRRAATEGTS